MHVGKVHIKILLTLPTYKLVELIWLIIDIRVNSLNKLLIVLTTLTIYDI